MLPKHLNSFVKSENTQYGNAESWFYVTLMQINFRPLGSAIETSHHVHYWIGNIERRIVSGWVGVQVYKNTVQSWLG